MKKKIITAIVTSVFAVASVAAVASFMHFGDVVAEEINHDGAYLNSVTITAEDVSNGSGKVVVNGNSFTYTDFIVADGKIVLGMGSSIALDNESGSEAGTVLRGAGITTGSLHVADASSGSLTINGYDMPYEFPANYIANAQINDSLFDMSIGSGSLSLSALTLQYLCGEEATNIDGFANEYFYTSKIKSRTISASENADYSTNFFAVKRSDALYVFATQHVVNRRDTGGNWWEKDNVELRLGTKTNIPASTTHQFWYSSLNGGSSSDGQVGVNVAQRDGYYEITFEIKLDWAILGNFGYSFDDEILMSAGVAYATNAFRTTPGWDQPAFDCYEITSQGLVLSNILNVFSKRGTALISEPIHAEWPGEGPNWNSTVNTQAMDGSQDWMLRYEIDSFAHETKRSDNAAGYVGEVYSPLWANGGWTFRQDWWGWGTWNNVPNAEGNCGQHGHFEGTTINDGNVFDAIDHMKVTAYIYFDSNDSRIYYVAKYTSEMEAYLDQSLYVFFYSTNVSYRGTMNVSFGYNFGGVTFDSIELISGSLA